MNCFARAGGLRFNRANAGNRQINMTDSLKKCLIANRGEIAVRIIRACRELNMQAVAVYSDVDAAARHIHLADEAYPIGPANPAASYLNAEKLVETALRAGCDCVHPGYGFLSENEVFAQAVIDAGLVWVGPRPETIRLMGVKTEARALMAQAGVPLAPGFASDRATNAEFSAAAAEIGYPVMVKAAGGGGGKGIRIVREATQLADALDSARREAQNAFGDARVFLEKYIEAARHIEVQIIADAAGSVLHLFERECSVQRRHQKIIEETPSPLLDAGTRQAVCAAAVSAARAAGYVNAGTVEFIFTPERDFYFLEMNTRLQVEHPITELVTGVDVVKLQFSVAAGERLPFTQDEVRQQGHAIECRVYAEDPRSGFLPAVGAVLSFAPPAGPGIRVDTGLQAGDEVTIHYDPMIAKVVVHDRTREAAIQRMRQALSETVILGTTTNIDFLRALLDNPEFHEGSIHTGYVDEHLNALMPPAPALDEAAVIALAVAEAHNSGHNYSKGGNTLTQGNKNVYDPWARGDGFRLGTKRPL